MIRNSIKQLFRTPVRTILFFLLILASALLLVLGINLWQMNVESLREFENVFTTIGTVEQKADAITTEASWDAGTKEYTYLKSSEYGAWFEPSDLLFPDAGYVVEPRKRPYFGAYMPQYTLYNEQETESRKYGTNQLIVEVVPLTTGTADPIEVKIKKVLNGSDYLAYGTTWICDHSNPDPVVLESGRTYVMEIGAGGMPHDVEQTYVNFGMEYHIGQGPVTTQCTEDGKSLARGENRIDEVVEGFYETERGKAWLNSDKQSDMWTYTVPVQSTDRTDLLMPFYNNEAYIADGRDITDKEYDTGKDVCLVSKRFADYNHLKIGDCLELPLYYASFGDSPGINFWRGASSKNFSLLNAQKEIYSVFDQDSYEIVGTYDVDRNELSAFGIGENEVIVPFQSVQSSWSGHIASSGPMKRYNTSFQIENGEIETFMRKWKEQGIEGLQITFYDGGYSELKEGIENRRVMTYVFLTGGGTMAVLVLLLFCHLFIARQERRTAIERSLGMTKTGSALSMLAGLLLVVILGAAAGSTAGYAMTGEVAEKTAEVQYFSSEYTSGSSEEAEADTHFNHTDKEGAVWGFCMILTLSGLITGVYMYRNLKKEPLHLLSCAEE